MRLRLPASLFCVLSLCLTTLAPARGGESVSASAPAAAEGVESGPGVPVDEGAEAPAPTPPGPTEAPQAAPREGEEKKAPAPSQPVAPAPAPIVSVEVRGYERVPEADIRAAIASKPGAPYSEQQVDRDRLAVRDLGWFQEVSVVRESVEGGIRLTFRVIENPVVRDIQFQGIKELSREQLLAAMQTKPGDVYNGFRLREDGLRIEKLYQERGYILAQVLGAESMTAEGVLVLLVAEGVIEAVKVTGNTYTKEYVIRRYIRTRPGDTYSDARVAQDVTRLGNTGYFETVRRDAEVGAEAGKVIVVITVVEKKHTGQASIAGAYSSTQGVVGIIDLTKGNLRGTGQMVSVRGEWGGRKSYEFGYRNPWIMSPETRLSLGVYDRFILREAFVTTTEGDRRSILYDERRAGGNITLGRPLSDRTTVYLGFRRDDVSISGLSKEEEPFLAGPAFIPREVRSVTMAAISDRRDNRFDPRQGRYHQFSVEFAGIFGGVDFNKYWMDNRAYLRAGKKSVFAVRLLAGTTAGDVPYLEQFLIGGTDSLRGYRTDRFAGANMAILNAELRFPISSSLIGVGFVDLGDAWGGTIARDPFFQGDESFTAHLGYGVGVRVQTQIAVLRLDLGFSEEGTETHFGVSHMF